MTAKPRASAPVRLLGDIGGTNARFALQTAGGRAKALKKIKTADFPDLTSAAKAYLAATSPARPPRVAAFAVASPVTGDGIRLTTSPRSFSATDARPRPRLHPPPPTPADPITPRSTPALLLVSAQHYRANKTRSFQTAPQAVTLLSPR